MNILAIDPGKDGFLCFMTDRGLAFFPTPTVKVGKSKREYDTSAMRRTLREFGPCSVYIERQQAMRKSSNGRTQGTSSSFAIGLGYGLWQGLILGLGMPLTIVSPQQWQKVAFQGVSGEGKERSIIAAGRLYPTVDLRKSELARKPHNGKADALLIAHWAKVMNEDCTKVHE